MAIAGRGWVGIPAPIALIARMNAIAWQSSGHERPLNKSAADAHRRHQRKSTIAVTVIATIVSNSAPIIRSMPLFSASTRRQPFRPWTDSIPYCRSHRGDLNATDSSTSDMEHFLSTQRSIQNRERSSARRQHVTPAKSSSPFFYPSCRRSRKVKKSTSFWTVSRLTKPTREAVHGRLRT